MLSTDLNTAPYHDDFDLKDLYFKYLFKSGEVIQTRELNGIQSLLQSQIEKLGNYVLTEGSVVLPGHSFADADVYAVPLNTFVNGVEIDSYIESLKGVELIGSSTQIKARVVDVLKSIDSEKSVPTLYVKYLNTSPTDGSTEFLDNEYLLLDDEIVASVLYFSGGLTKAILAKVNAGIYYIRGIFIETEGQEIIVEQYNNTGSYKIGFFVEEKIIKATDDAKLYDNAIGINNDTVSGADRIKIDLKFSSIPISEASGDNFVELIRISNGVVVVKKKETFNKIVNSELEKTLARRTYDESGDYIVDKFDITAENTLNNFRNNGVYEIYDYTSDGKLVRASETANENNINGLSHYTLKISQGKAYVRGFELAKNEITLLEVEKPNSQESRNNNTNVYSGSSYIKLDSIQEQVSTSTIEKIYFKDSSANVIGEALALGLDTGNRVYISNLATYDVLNVDSVVGLTAKGVVIGNTSKAIGFIEYINFNDIVISNKRGKFINGEVLKFSNFTETPTLISTVDYLFSDTSDVFKADQTTLIGSFGAEVPTVLKDGENRYLNTVERYNSSVNDVSYNYIKTFAFNGTPLNNSEPFLGSGILIDSTGNQSIDVTIDSSGNVSGNGAITSGTIYAVVLKGNTVPKTKTKRTNKILNITSNDINDFYGTRYYDEEISLGVPDVFNILTVRKSQDPNNLLSTFSSIDLNDASQVNVGDILFGKTTNASVEIVHKIGNKVYFVELNDDVLALNETVYIIENDSLTDLITTSEVSSGYYVDLTNNYKLETNINSDTYSISKLSLTNNSTPADAPIVIVYSYYEHSISGDYFTVDSYIDDYQNIGIEGEFNLSDLIDFRLTADIKVSNNGTLDAPYTLVQEETLDITKNSYNKIDFINSGSIFTYDQTYYLTRSDRLFLKSDGQFSIVQGEYNINPRLPEVPENGLVIADIFYPAYVRDVKDIQLKFYSHRRYTMKDIGKLDDRIQGIEYYVSLNLLESETANLNILDDSNLSRFKNGFIVDPFNEGFSSTADYQNPQFKASIDKNKEELRPQYYSDNIQFVYLNGNDIKIKGSVATLDYFEDVFIRQSLASKTENLNPFGSFDWVGSLHLTPASDFWVETNRLPDRSIFREGNFLSTVRSVNQGVNWVGVGEWVTTRSSTVSNWENLGRSRQWRGIRQDLRQTTFSTQSRTITGFRNVVDARIDVSVNDNLVNSSSIAKVRRQYITVFGTGLRPNTPLSLIVNGINVDEHVFPNKFDAISTRGNIFTTGTIYFQRNINNVWKNIAIATVNVIDSQIGRIEISNILTPNSSRLASPTDLIPRSGDRIFNPSTFALGTVQGLVNTSNEFGDYLGYFLVPFEKFDTGELEFRLTNTYSPTIGTNKVLTSYTTSASANFPVAGTTRTFRRDIVSTRNANVRTEVVRASQSRNTVSSSIVATRRIDPLAQSFFIELEENSDSPGIYLTALEVFFATKPTTNDGSQVKVSIRTMENGIPTNEILPNSEVYLNSNQINVSTNGSVGTKFEFETPIYVKKDSEYCFVVEPGTSTDYNVFISRLGERDLITNITIDKQPYIGSLFKSQNQSTWDASQFEDMKFTLYKADFSRYENGTSKNSMSGTLNLKNAVLLPDILDTNPLIMTSGSSLVKVYHPNHSLNKVNTNYVKFSGVESNIPNGILNTTITDTNPNNLVVTIGNSDLFPVSGDIKIGSDIYSYTRSGNDFTITAYQLSDEHNSGEAVECYVLNGISLRDINDVNIQVTSVDNLDYYSVTLPTNALSDLKSGGKNVRALSNVQYSSIFPSIEHITPENTEVKLGLAGYSGTSIYYKDDIVNELSFIKDSTETAIIDKEENTFNPPKLIASSTNIEENGILDDWTCKISIDLNSVDKNVSPIIDLERCYGLFVSNRINYDQNADDNKLDANTDCSYVTNKVTLKNPATSAKVYLDAVRFETSDITCFVKIKRDDENTPFEEIEYIEMPLVGNKIYSKSYDDFKEISFELNNLPEFKEAAFKVVMKSKSQSIIPRFKRFRGILLAL